VSAKQKQSFTVIQKFPNHVTENLFFCRVRPKIQFSGPIAILLHDSWWSSLAAVLYTNWQSWHITEWHWT